jgi:hypothetical protein
MKINLPVLALVSLLGGCAAKPDDTPRVELTDVGFALHLPPAMQQALDSLAPGFRTVRSANFRSDISQAAASGGGSGLPAAFAAVGDFDRDGSSDAVVEGTSPNDKALQVIAIMNGTAPSAVQVMRFPVYDADAVGVYLSTPPAGVTGAFEVVAYPDSTLLYHYTSDGFQGRNIGG